MNFDVLSYIASINAARTKDEACLIYEQAIRSIGITGLRYSTEYIDPETRMEPKNGIISGYPEDWVKYYTDRNFHFDDPISVLAPTSSAPFVWADIETYLPYTKRQKAIMYESKDAGLVHGITHKIQHSPYEYAVANYFSSERDFAPNADTVALISAIGYIFHQKFVALDESYKEQETGREIVQLSMREREILKWVAQGKSIPDIATIMSIGNETVKTFLKRIYQKMGVNDRVSAVQKGTMLGLVEPYRQAFKRPS